MSEATAIPQGFRELRRANSPYLASLGPIYAKGEGNGMVIALRIEEKHLNTRGVAHGGMLVTLADSAMGIVLATSHHPMVTVNLSADFADVARAGDWVEARVDVQKLGKRLAFASCQVWVGEKRILRASGIFARAAGVGGNGSQGVSPTTSSGGTT
ncbi:MAG TPA: PaaI family thioesterase [Myxococcales bacterium]|nr:PaaI family thioesterase [Myxococcales bacterium]